MTGASAGGLNAVLMAQSIRSATPFAKFLGLWQDHADIDLLLKGPLHATKYDERAVLKGKYFEDSLRDALQEPAHMVPLTQNLAVFASATLVRPNPVEFKDVPGAPIAETRSDAYFHIAQTWFGRCGPRRVRALGSRDRQRRRVGVGRQGDVESARSLRAGEVSNKRRSVVGWSEPSPACATRLR